MLYRYNPHTLLFDRVTYPQKVLIATILIFILSLSLVFYNTSTRIEKKRVEAQVMIIMSQQTQFDTIKLINKIKELHFQFPWIVYGQAVLETNNFKSRIFLENSNLFGMKEATQRITLSKGSQSSFAYYNNWMDSLYDYAFYSALYLSKLSTEEEYYNYLSQFYAEDSLYTNKLRNLITIDIINKHLIHVLSDFFRKTS